MNDTHQRQPRTRSWWQRLVAARGGLKRTLGVDRHARSPTSSRKRKLDAATLEELEEVLIRADLGVDGRGAHRRGDRRRAATTSRSRADEVKAILAAEVEKMLGPVAKPLTIDAAQSRS